MKKRYYVKFDTPDRWSFDAGWYESIEEAAAYAKQNNYKGFYSVKRSDGFVIDGTGFKPHYNHGLGKWVETRREYYQELKDRNLIELGNEKLDPKKYNEAISAKASGKYLTDEVIDYCRETGNTLDDVAVKELRKDGL